MTAHATLKQRIAHAAQGLDARHEDLVRHRMQLQARVISEVRKSHVVVGVGVLLLALTWHRMRYRRRD